MRLPPLPSLRAFEAAARHHSFKAAAQELFVTPSAISHHVRHLEDQLGTLLLHRNPRGVALTDDGAMLYAAAHAGFAGIARAVDHLTRRALNPVLTLTSTSAFLSHWLMPRLGALQDHLPSMDLRLHASDRIESLHDGTIDVAIRYGRNSAPDTASTMLCADAMVPVCSPALGITGYGDLRGATLIHIDGRAQPDPAPDWVGWCRMAGVEIDTRNGLHFPDSMLAVQAAIAGHGIVIVSRVLVQSALEGGVLVQPFAQAIEGAAYHFACAAHRGQEPALVALRQWFAVELSFQMLP
jgi:LysR family transcriptional regulator, glycine cleavage system transcriptional activator